MTDEEQTEKDVLRCLLPVAGVLFIIELVIDVYLLVRYGIAAFLLVSFYGFICATRGQFIYKAKKAWGNWIQKSWEAWK